MEKNFIIGLNQHKSAQEMGKEKGGKSSDSGCEISSQLSSFSINNEYSDQHHQFQAGPSIQKLEAEPGVFPAYFPQSFSSSPTKSAPPSSSSAEYYFIRPPRPAHHDQLYAPQPNLQEYYNCNDHSGDHNVALPPFHPNRSLGAPSSANIHNNYCKDNQRPPRYIETTRGFMINENSSSLSHCRSDPPPTHEPGKLTIFYGDDVYIYDNVYPAKAEVIMSMASKDITITSELAYGDDAFCSNHDPQTTLDSNDQRRRQRSSDVTSSCNIPQTISKARKASVQRFIEKRRSHR